MVDDRHEPGVQRGEVHHPRRHPDPAHRHRYRRGAHRRRHRPRDRPRRSSRWCSTGSTGPPTATNTAPGSGWRSWPTWFAPTTAASTWTAPRARAAPSPSPSRSSSPPGPPGRLDDVTAESDQSPIGAVRPSVLVVEDDTDLREFLTRLLTGDGWVVRAVADAETALELTGGSSDAPDVVITDVVLPGRDGLALIQQLRRQPATQRTPMIVLTARHGADATAEGLAAGADDYITKPFSAHELLARVRANHELAQLREKAISQAQGREQQIRAGLDSNRVIGTAVGIVMAVLSPTAAAAVSSCWSPPVRTPTANSATSPPTSPLPGDCRCGPLSPTNCSSASPAPPGTCLTRIPPQPRVPPPRESCSGRRPTTARPLAMRTTGPVGDEMAPPRRAHQQRPRRSGAFKADPTVFPSVAVPTSNTCVLAAGPGERLYRRTTSGTSRLSDRGS